MMGRTRAGMGMGDDTKVYALEADLPLMMLLDLTFYIDVLSTAASRRQNTCIEDFAQLL